MNISNVALLVSMESWFVPYAQRLKDHLCRDGYKAEVFMDHQAVDKTWEVVFILSYFGIVLASFLALHKHNIVVHESALPEGRGWSPLSWQILEGKAEIPITLFEATAQVDAGDIYIRDVILFSGGELCDEIRVKQAQKTEELCLRFLEEYKTLKPQPQTGGGRVYPKRTPADSELDLNKSIKEQLNLLRIVDNERYPAFFYHNNQKYILQVKKAETDGK